MVKTEPQGTEARSFSFWCGLWMLASQSPRHRQGRVLTRSSRNGSKTRASGTQTLPPFVRSPCSFRCFLLRLLRKSLRQHPQAMSIKK